MTSAATTQSATTGETAVINKMIASVQQLSAIRPAITARAITPAAVMTAYSGILAQELSLFIQENQSLTNATAATQSQANITSAAGREALSQEDAIVSAALAAHQATAPTRIQVSELAGRAPGHDPDAPTFVQRPDLAAWFNAQMNH